MFWDVQVPKTHSIFDDLLGPGRPASVPLRHAIATLGAGYAVLWQMTGRRVRMFALLPLWR